MYLVASVRLSIRLSVRLLPLSRLAGESYTFLYKMQGSE